MGLKICWGVQSKCSGLKATNQCLVKKCNQQQLPWPKTALKTAWQDTNQARVSLISEGFKLQIVFGDTFHRLLLRLYHPPQKIGSPKTFLAFPWLFHQMFWSQRKRPISSRSVFFSPYQWEFQDPIYGGTLVPYFRPYFLGIFPEI